MNATEKRARFRAVLAGDRCVSPADVFDPISARIAEDLGFELAMLPGSIASLTVLGAPDLVVLTLTELAEQVRRICRASEIPLMVDADHGFGNALSVKRTVEELEAAGAAALTIEDTLLPAPFGADETQQFVSIEEGVGKLRAALAGRRDPALALVGRTSAIGVTGVEDAVARVKAYAATGVDAVFLARVTTRAQVDALTAAVDVPVLLGGVPAALYDREDLGRRGVRICLAGQQGFFSAVQAVQTTLAALRAGTPPGAVPNLAPPELIKRVSREAEYRRWREAFLGDAPP